MASSNIPFISVTLEVSHPLISPLNVVFPENAALMFVILEVSHPLIDPNVEFTQLPTVDASAKQSVIAPEIVASVNGGGGGIGDGGSGHECHGDKE